MATPFRDFIPEGENPGAQGQVFRDFVSERQPQEVEPTAQTEEQQETPKKKGRAK